MMAEKTDYSELLKNRHDTDGELYSMIKFVLILLTVFVLFAFTFTQVFIGVRVCGQSMNPTLYGGELGSDGIYRNGDYLFVCTLSSPDYGDIVVFDSVDGAGNLEVIKRVVGLPGDRISAKDGILYRAHGDGEFTAVNEPYITEGWTGSFEEQIVPEGCFFVLGDNRLNSTDSRSYGPVPQERLLGVVTGSSVALKGIITGIVNFFGIFAL